MSSSVISRTRGVRLLLLVVTLLVTIGVTSVLWRANHGGDAPVRLGRIPMPFPHAHRPLGQEVPP